MNPLEWNLIDIYNFVHPIIHGAYVSDSIMLLCLTIVDTVLGVGWRIRKGRPVWSNRFKSGLLFNVTLSFLPQLVGVAFHMIHEPKSQLLMFVIESLTIFIALSQLQSIFANAVLFGIKIPKWFKPFYDAIILPEVEKKDDTQEKER